MDLRLELQTLHRASFGWAMSCCRSQRQEAEDVLHSVYIKVLEGRARFDGRSSFRTWLFSVIHRTVQEHRRRHWFQAALLDRWRESEPLQAAAAGEDARATDRERNSQLSSALARLSRRQQEVLHLVFYQDLTIEESARTLGLSLGSARTHFERGKKRLRALLREDSLP